VSRENVEMVRAICEPWMRGDLNPVDRAHPDTVLDRFGGRGRASGVDLGQMQSRGANPFEIRDGKVMRLVTYLDRAEALEAVGLRE
jgi:ketosteroid isomerase-like protein